MNDHPQVPTDFANLLSPFNADAEHASNDPWVPGLPHDTAATRAARLANAMAYLVDRDDGWLRLIPSRDGSKAYAKWKFTAGRYSGSYVMVLVQPWNSMALPLLLVDALLKVDAGMLRPTLDKYFALD
jgi:hypothetical protein